MAPMLVLFEVLLLLTSFTLSCGAANYSGIGSDFYIGAARNIDGKTDYFNITVLTVATSPVRFVVETSNMVIYNGSTTSTKAQIVTIPTTYVVQNSYYDNRDKGIHVYSTDSSPISVVVNNYQHRSSGQYLALPCNQPFQPEYEYYAVSTGSFVSGADSQILIVGCSNNTNIIIIPTQNIRVPQNFSDPSSSRIMTVTAGSSFEVAIYQMQTLLISSSSDLSGTKIISTKPITVISGHECANVPRNVLYCEHITVQVPPTNTWGKNFFLLPFAARSSGQYFKAIASRSQTTLNYDSCSFNSSLTLTNVGDVFEFWTNSSNFCIVYANHPILLVQISLGFERDNVGDPAIFMVPSTEQFINKVAFVSMNEEYHSQFVSVAVQTQHFNVQKIFLDGEPLNSTWTAIKGKNGATVGYGTRKRLAHNSTHTIYHDDPKAGLSVSVYGFSESVSSSFAYNGGLSLRQTTEYAEPLTLKPWYGSTMGGTVVLVSGPTFKETDEVVCKFEEIEEYGVVIDEIYTACTTPQLSTIGRIPFQLYINKEAHPKDAVFYSMQEESNYSVNMQSLLYTSDENITVTWDNSSFYPPEISITSDSIIVEIALLKFSADGSTTLIETWIVNNTGEETLEIPDLSEHTSTQNPVLLSEIVLNAKLRLSRKRRVNSRVISVAKKFAKSYIISSALFRLGCELWSATQGDQGKEILDRLRDYPCPPTLNQIKQDNSGFKEESIPYIGEIYRSYFHPGNVACYRQSRGLEQTQGSGNQCCYRKDGTLNVGPPGGGTVDLYSPQNHLIKHQFYDVIPYILCCKGAFSKCEEYYKHRPSDNGTGYMPDPPACVYGDPHIITLDLYKYTFNGKGEFTLIEVEDGSFILQGRMVEATGNNSNPVSATVFSAIAAKQMDSDTVQFQLDAFKGLVALVNGEEVDLSELKEQLFNKVTINALEGRVMTATFTNGAYIKVKEENSIISVLIVSLPTRFQGETQGLMGNYNGDQSDDLKPKDRPILPVNSSTSDIHYHFGLTWLISKSEDSIFSYEGGQDWSSFYDPKFSPVFEPTFTDADLEMQAKEMCKNDTFCLFDIATSGRVDIGLSTLSASIEFDQIVELSAAVSCEPPCENGACVANDVCSCSEGYVGPRCEQIVYEQCDENPCMNGGECLLYARTYICNCTEPYSGYFCQDKPADAESSNHGFLAGIIVAIIIVLIIAILVTVCIYVGIKRLSLIHI